MNWGKIFGTATDIATLGAQPLSWMLTGQSVSENLGMDSAIDLDKKSDNLTDFMKNTYTSQQQLAGQLYNELQQEGRPMQEAEVNRLQQISSLAKGYADQGMPEGAYQNAVQNIERGTSAALSGAASRGSALNAMGSVYGNQLGAFRDLGAQDAMMQQQNQGNYLNSLQNLASAEGRAEAYNALLPYEQKMAEYQSLAGSSMQNQYFQNLFNYQTAMGNRQMAADLAGAGISAAGQMGGAAIASDERLKENMDITGYSGSGIPIVQFNYIGDNAVYQGTTAQYLIEAGRDDAVVRTYTGYYAVRYDLIDVEFKQVDVNG